MTIADGRSGKLFRTLFFIALFFTIAPAHASSNFQVPGRFASTTVFSASTSTGNADDARRAVDGNLAGASFWSAKGSGEWLTLGTGIIKPVSALAIAFAEGDSRYYYFSVETSIDGKSWTTVLANARSSGQTSGFELFEFRASNAALVRITGYGNSANPWNAIAEVKVLTDETRAVNVYWPLDADASKYSRYTPDLSIDNNYSDDSRWSAWGRGEWLSVDLGAPAQLNGVLIDFLDNPGRVDYFSVATSMDGSNWTPALTDIASAANRSGQAFPFTTRLAKYIRITGNGNSADQWNNLVEVKAYLMQEPLFSNGGASTTQRFLPVSASASSDDGQGHDARSSIDSSLTPESRWSTTGIGEWLAIDLGSRKTVNGITVGFEKGYQQVTDFSLQASNNGDNWFKVTGQIASSGDSPTVLETFAFQPVQARYFRIVNRGNGSDNRIGVIEFFPWYDAAQAATSTNNNSTPTPVDNTGGTNTTPTTPTTRQVNLSWQQPNRRENGSALAAGDISGYMVYYYLQGQTLKDSVIRTVAGGKRSLQLNLAPGKYVFAIACVDSGGLISQVSARKYLAIQ